jgi:molybdenum cofactor biosynthesis enzyme MoaA
VGFFEGGVRPLVASVLTHEVPLYVQYYVTARCNLRCQQCNVIYSNADQEECTTRQAEQIAENMAAIGASIVLLTGGEPFIRTDIVDIAAAFVRNGVHPRLQTNGLASFDQLDRMVDIGAHDISISLDTLVPALQDEINGGYAGSWYDAIRRVAHINATFPNNAFCAFGCVLAPSNIDQIVPVIEFATRIGWWVSLVPAHQTPTTAPRSFATYDPALVFRSQDYPRVRALLDQVREMKRQGYNLYDSDEYLSDIYRYVTREPIRWRRRNGGACDSPNLYFALQPNGDMAVCCDFRLGTSFPAYDERFPDWYRNKVMFPEAQAIAKACSGCMYGSFPEITISARYLRPLLQRASLFMRGGLHRQLAPMRYEEMIDLAATLASRVGVHAKAGSG